MLNKRIQLEDCIVRIFAPYLVSYFHQYMTLKKVTAGSFVFLCRQDTNKICSLFIVVCKLDHVK